MKLTDDLLPSDLLLSLSDDLPRISYSIYFRLGTLAVKTPIKIVLFGAGNTTKHCEREHIEALNELCRQWCQHSCGDIFYAINFHDKRHHTFFYEAENDGAIPEFTFRKVEELSGPDNLASA